MTGRRLLLVCGAAAETEIFAGVFRWRGWDVDVATSMAEALDRLDPPPDCLFAARVSYQFLLAARSRLPTTRIVLYENWEDGYDDEVHRRVKEQGLGLKAD